MLLLLQESKQWQFEPKTFLVNRWGGCGEINNFHKLWYCEKDFSGFSSATLYEYWNQEQCCKTMNRSWLIVTGSVNCSYMKMTVSWMLPVQERTWGHRKHLHLDLVFRLKIFKKKKVTWYLWLITIHRFLRQSYQHMEVKWWKLKLIVLIMTDTFSSCWEWYAIIQ